MLVIEMPYFVLCSDIAEEPWKDTVDYRSNNARHGCHCVSDLAPSKMDFQASPRGGAEADFEAPTHLIIGGL